MKTSTDLGSRIAEVHNGSSLFTGDAGQGESNIRRWIIENDWLEAIVALPLNMFYNTGIATYVWVLTNRKEERRKGKVQLINAVDWFRPLRKNLGKKTCELGEEDIERICAAFDAFEETEQSKIFPNEAFGYWKVTVERPLRLAVDLSPAARDRFRATCREAGDEPLADAVDRAAEEIGESRCLDWNRMVEAVESAAAKASLRMTAKRRKSLRALTEHDPEAEPVILKRYPAGKSAADPIRGRFASTMGRRALLVEYEPDPDLHDTEQIPLMEEGGIEGFLTREVLRWASDAWYDTANVKVGYEISFTRHFFQPEPMRPQDEIRADFLEVRRRTDLLLDRLFDASTVRRSPATSTIPPRIGKPHPQTDA